MSTGPLRPELAITNALRTVAARSSTRCTMKLCLVIGIVMPAMFTSWNESLPSRSLETLPVMATTGTLSMYAVAMPVTRLVAPGPLVARQTPVFPVLRA